MKQKTPERVRTIKPVFAAGWLSTPAWKEKEPNALLDVIRFTALLPVCLLAFLVDHLSLHHHQ